jgi:hypothetical protein
MQVAVRFLTAGTVAAIAAAIEVDSTVACCTGEVAAVVAMLVARLATTRVMAECSICMHIVPMPIADVDKFTVQIAHQVTDVQHSLVRKRSPLFSSLRHPFHSQTPTLLRIDIR